MDKQFPGFRFRIVDEQDSVREHIRLVIRGEAVNDLSFALDDVDEVIEPALGHVARRAQLESLDRQLLAALSGGEDDGGDGSDGV